MYTGAHLLQFLNVAICSLNTLFFKYIKLHQMLSQFSTINLAQVLEINVFGRDYSNLNNIFQRVNLQYIYKDYCREYGQHMMQQKRRSLLALHFFLKNILPRIFFNLVLKESFAPKGTFSIRLIGA